MKSLKDDVDFLSNPSLTASEAKGSSPIKAMGSFDVCLVKDLGRRLLELVLGCSDNVFLADGNDSFRVGAGNGNPSRICLCLLATGKILI